MNILKKVVDEQREIMADEEKRLFMIDTIVGIVFCMVAALCGGFILFSVF